MPKRGGRGRGRGGRGGGGRGQPRERRPALLGAPKPRPAPVPQPLSREEIEDAPTPKKDVKVRAPLSAYDELVAGIQRSALSTKRAAANNDLPPKKILAKEVDPAEEDEDEDAANLPADAVSDTEPADGGSDGDNEINDQQLAAAVCHTRKHNVVWLFGVEQPKVGDTYKLHYEHTLSETDLRVLEARIKWQSIKHGAHGVLQHSSPLPSPPAVGTNVATTLGVKHRVAEQWAQRGDLTQEDARLFSLMNSYHDLLFTMRTPDNGERLRALYMLHAVNHIAKARDTVLSHNARLNALDGSAERPELRDQGFSRPRVLVLLPLRSAALECVHLLLQLAPKAQQKEIGYRKRFMSEFGTPEDEDEGVDDNADKPADFRSTFKGNTDDCFRLGIGFSRSAVRMYTEFYGSDMIIASPLGLRLEVPSDKNNITFRDDCFDLTISWTLIESPEEEKRDFGFLSSIEMVIMDQADVMLMQNWEHIDIVFNHLNLTPKKAHPTTDFSRVRTWELNGLARHYRQTLIFSSFLSVEFNALFNRLCSNYTGKIKITAELGGVVQQVVKQVKQVFQRIDPPSLEELDDVRFQYFSEHVMPRMRASAQSHTLIFVASYFEYVRVRNLFQKLADESELTFCKLSEYTKSPDMARGRTFFADGRAQFMLYTERAHFYHRLRIRSVKSMIFYGLPHYPAFYTELVNMLVGTDISCLALYTRFEAFELERIVGGKRCSVMLSSPQNTHMLAAT